MTERPIERLERQHRDIFARPEVGGFFEDETGWWLLDSIDPDDPSGGWFIGRDGDERFIEWARVPALTYHSRR